MANNLYDIFNKAASSMKSPIGYSLKTTYNGVLSSLENDYKKSSGGNQTSSSRDEVFGVSRTDYTGVSKMRFDDNGMSDDLESCIWRMALTVTGSLPIMFKDSQSYYIAKFPNETVGNTNRNPMCNSTQLCPLILDKQQQGRITVQDFKIGASFDFSGLVKQYFENFYGYAKVTFDDQTLFQKLIVNNCLRAQIILPESNKSFVVGIIGETPLNGKNACCYLTTPLLGANQWKDSGIIVSVTDSVGAHEVIPNGTTYTFPCLGNTYYPSKSKMEGMNKEGYTTWLERNAESFSSQLPELVKIGDMKCYVRLFVPKEMQAKAMELGLPEDVPPRIFQTYQGVVVEGGKVAQFQGPLVQRFEGVCRKWASVNASSSVGILYGNANQRPKTLQRGAGGTFSSGREEVRALFGHPNNQRYHDCSSLVCMLLYDANILKDEVKVAPSFGTSTFADAPAQLSNLLKPQYKIIKMDIKPDTKLCTGDIVWVEANENREKNHHAAFIYDEKNGKVRTLQIRGTSDTPMPLVRQLARSNPESGFYKHLLRVVVNNEQ